jgi:hypothetical protein
MAPPSDQLSPAERAQQRKKIRDHLAYAKPALEYMATASRKAKGLPLGKDGINTSLTELETWLDAGLDGPGAVRLLVSDSKYHLIGEHRLFLLMAFSIVSDIKENSRQACFRTYLAGRIFVGLKWPSGVEESVTLFEHFLWSYHSTSAPHHGATTDAALRNEQLAYAVGAWLHGQCSEPTVDEGVRTLMDLDTKVVFYYSRKLLQFLKGWMHCDAKTAGSASDAQDVDYHAGVAARERAATKHTHQLEIAKLELHNHKAKAAGLFEQYLKLFPAPTADRQAKMEEVFFHGFECGIPALADFGAFWSGLART